MRVASVGLAAGFLSGLFGVGGGVVIVPMLVLVAGFGHKVATGTSLTAIVPISLAGTVGYATGGEVDWAAAGWIALGAAGGAVLGTRLLVRIEAPLLQVLFAALMLVAAGRMFVAEPDPGGRDELALALVIGLVALGVASGVLAGLLGVGGGIVIVPALTLLAGVPLVLAKGTSLAVILPTAVIGTIRNRRSDLTALRAAAVVGLAGVVSALAASQLSLVLDATLSRVLFALLLVVMAVRLARTGLAGIRADRRGPDADADAGGGAGREGRSGWGRRGGGR